jgi:hypothetical protein
MLKRATLASFFCLNSCIVMTLLTAQCIATMFSDSLYTFARSIIKVTPLTTAMIVGRTSAVHHQQIMESSICQCTHTTWSTSRMTPRCSASATVHCKASRVSNGTVLDTCLHSYHGIFLSRRTIRHIIFDGL